MTVRVELALAPFDPAERLAQFSHAALGAGAIVSFTGLARPKARDGTVVTALVLESYRGVTLASMRAIGDDALSRFAISAADIVHRVGRIAPGEPIVFVATASAHRRAAFEAADYLMDRLKTEAVFWKREEGPEGIHWIEPTADDEADRNRWNKRQDG
ncbi:MAG: molybdenum cofactor biosynthesis protein MoaE [Sphingopyxis sp.]|jgi:molybdopterin synthase catalytic subunit|nr:molybdenum cofactor biosynthesis protein MoaE [Sphingopyxis sp.]